MVSNNKNNENSNVVEVVYMTTQPKTESVLTRKWRTSTLLS